MIDVVIYTKENCGPCKAVKQYIHFNRSSVGNKNRVSVIDDLSAAKDRNVKAFPTAFFDGEMVTGSQNIIKRLKGE